jgi:hypothetical protein
MAGSEVCREERLARIGTGDCDRSNVMSAIKSWMVGRGAGVVLPKSEIQHNGRGRTFPYRSFAESWEGDIEVSETRIRSIFLLG